MKIVICGAGIVGSAIARHLATEQNDVTVVDSDPEKIQWITEHADVGAVEGVASHPNILARAGLADSDLLIAVTESDEINMVSCQVAHTIFKTPTKIARIRSRSYLDPDVKSLYSPENMPIDHIISPEFEVSEAVGRQLRLPGAFDVKDMASGKIRVIGVLCQDNCPILETPLRHLTNLFPGLTMTIIAIIRGSEVIVPRDGTDVMQAGDRVYFACDAQHTERAMASFGHDEEEAHSVVIAGGGNIGLQLAQDIEARFDNTSAHIIERNKTQAHFLAEQLSQTKVTCGNSLEADILKEAGVETTETFVAVSNDDEVNILSALLAKRMGARHTVALVNMPGFIPLISTLGVDAVINPPQITVSSILEHIRRGRIYDVHSVIEGMGEVLEAEALSTSPLVGVPLRKARIPKGVAIGAILRNEVVLPARGDTIVEAGDKVVLFAKTGSAGRAETILSDKDDIF
jgi:trk system potassium uptake protein TrkA